MKNDSMTVALKSELLPALRERGFKGSFPHFRRIRPEKIDLLTVQFDKWGGGFVIEIAKCNPEGVTTSWGKHIPPSRVQAWDLHPNLRIRLGAAHSGQDGIWFRYDDGTPVEEVARRALNHLADAEHWWNSGHRARRTAKFPRVGRSYDDQSSSNLRNLVQGAG